jgi:radical SAM-linked protein
VRRSGLPYAVTQGFSPRMKLAFGPALPVGTAAIREHFDVWTTRYVPAAEAMHALQAATPADLAPHAVAYVALGEPSLGAAVTLAEYDVDLEGTGVTHETVQEALDAVIGSGRLEVEHKGKQKVFDLARSLPKEVRVGSTGSGVTVSLTTRMGQEGSLRPDVLCTVALSRARCDGAVVRVTRTDTFIEDEEGPRRPL